MKYSDFVVKKKFKDLAIGTMFFMENEYDCFAKYTYNIGMGEVYHKIGIDDEQDVYVTHFSMKDVFNNRILFDVPEIRFNRIKDDYLSDVDVNWYTVKLFIARFIGEKVLNLNSNISMDILFEDETRVDALFGGDKIEKYIEDKKL